MLFDQSGITRSEAIRTNYLADFDRVVASLKPGDTVIGDRVTDKTLTTASLPINETLPTYDPLTTNQAVYTEDQQKVFSGLHDAAQRLLTSSGSNTGTDLFSALRLAGQVLSPTATTTGQQRCLILFTDGAQQAGGIDFTTGLLDEREIKAIIARQKRAKALPDLRSVAVWMDRASAPTLSPARIEKIERFWSEYFAACGTTLPETHAAPRLIHFPFTTVETR